MIRLSLTDTEFDTLKRDLNLLQTFRRLAMVPTAPNAHLIPKVEAELKQTAKLFDTLNEQEQLQQEITQIVPISSLTEEQPGVSGRLPGLP